MSRKGPKQMTLNAFYLNLLKFLIMAFVLAFIVYAANANEVIMDIAPFPACTNCLDENADSNNSNKIPFFLKIPIQSKRTFLMIFRKST